MGKIYGAFLRESKELSWINSGSFSEKFKETFVRKFYKLFWKSSSEKIHRAYWTSLRSFPGKIYKAFFQVQIQRAFESFFWENLIECLFGKIIGASMRIFSNLEEVSYKVQWVFCENLGKIKYWHDISLDTSFWFITADIIILIHQRYILMKSVCIVYTVF